MDTLRTLVEWLNLLWLVVGWLLTRLWIQQNRTDDKVERVRAEVLANLAEYEKAGAEFDQKHLASIEGVRDELTRYQLNVSEQHYDKKDVTAIVERLDRRFDEMRTDYKASDKSLLDEMRAMRAEMQQMITAINDRGKK